MTFSSSIVADLAIIMIIAAVVVYLFYRLKQPMVIGYLVAGVIIGP
jgi:CPA2 family monovalent cation:H+ antiporter-2